MTSNSIDVGIFGIMTSIDVLYLFIHHVFCLLVPVNGDVKKVL